MGAFLNSSGNLTESQKVQADSMGISHSDFKLQILERLYELRGGLPVTERTSKMVRTNITAKKPVLIIGAGSSFQSNIANIKNFPGDIIAVDFVFNELAEHDIHPDYVVTLESSKNAVSEHMFRSENLKRVKHKSKIICSSITRSKVIEYFKQHGVQLERFVIPEEPRCSNVGLLAINYAYDKLKADKIVLIGFEHVGQKYEPHIYQIWQTDFWYFIRKWPKELIVNCTDSGALYYEDYIIDAKLGEIAWKMS